MKRLKWTAGMVLVRKISSEAVIYMGLALTAVLAIPICVFGALAMLVWEGTDAVVRFLERME